MKFAKAYYVKDSEKGKECTEIRLALRPLLQLYTNEKARNFGPLALKAVRQYMVDVRSEPGCSQPPRQQDQADVQVGRERRTCAIQCLRGTSHGDRVALRTNDGQGDGTDQAGRETMGRRDPPLRLAPCRGHDSVAVARGDAARRSCGDASLRH